MAESELPPTQRHPAADIVAELQIEGFENAEEIGKGGFGIVYRCDQPELDRTVAVKVLTASLDEESMERFAREQHAMGRLSGHPHIVPIFQIGTTNNGRPFIVMQYHGQGSLESHIRGTGPLSWVETLRLGVKMAGALEAAHRVGTLHRDVKPGNILLTDYGEPQLTDFGIARVVGGFETGTGVITGSPGFTAPEVLDGASPTISSDVYSLGATLFCALTGHAAYERRSGEQIMAQFLRVAAQPVPDLRKEGMPDDVAAAIEWAMAAQASDRPTAAVAFGNELRDIQRRNGIPVDEMAVPGQQVATQRKPAASRPGSSRTSVRSTMPPTPATKYRPPPPARNLVRRDRLLDTLRAGRRKRLSLIHAPSGFGKTTLATQWRDELIGGGIAVAWLSIDDDDNNVTWFLAHLIESIRNIRPKLAGELDEVLEAHPDAAQRHLLTSLINELHNADDRVVVIIDDWHHVTDKATRAALGFLLDNGCHHLPMVVTSDARARLALSRLRISDEVIDIGTEALRFDSGELRAFFAGESALALSDTDIEALSDATDGWGAALQLAILALRTGAEPQRLIGHMSGHDDIGEFLAENVVDALDPELLNFLVTTSITEQVCAGLASALTRTARSQSILEEIEDRGLFLHRVDEKREWFRYHPLFAEYLRRRLDRDNPERIEELHNRASAWFAEHNMLNEAVDHALAAGSPEHAIDLVEQGEAFLLERSKMTTLLGILAKLPPRLVVSRPRIQLLLAWINILLQRLVPTHTALNRFELACDKAVLTEAEKADLRAEADVVRAVEAIFADRVDTADSLVQDALSRPDSFPPRVSGVAGNIASFVAIYRFDFDAARRWQEWAAPYHELMGPFATIYGRCFAGLAAKEQLDIAAASTAFQDAYDIAVRLAGQHSHAARLAGALLGELLYEQGDLAAATTLLDESYEIGNASGGVDFMIATYTTGARLLIAKGDLDAAAQRLAAGLKTAHELALPRLAARVLNEQIRLGHDIGPLDTERLLTPRILQHPDGIATITAEFDEGSAVRLLLASADPDSHAQACERARALADGIDSRRRPLAALRAKLLVGMALSAAGRSEGAAELAAAAAICTRTGLVRLAADAAPGIALP
ncbi:protein kinase [Skermania sp. ID1734]|uniref:serine/threonine-protein kinase n=1 Tax=Skermania sp. ID1734 TaxID=2597516 RepID=UPI0011805843|nr:serine/threonine-protein kinase [Skermania sp. ID1734]TSD93663.1 protein kinase [Skermania sp. ID1734]